MDHSLDRLPPYSDEGERGILGSVLLDFGKVMGICMAAGVVEESFYVPAHRSIYRAMLTLQDKGGVIDVLTITQTLRDSDSLEQIGGAVFLDRLIDSTPTAAHAPYYVEIVMKEWLKRRIIEENRNTESALYDGENDPVELLASQIHRLSEFSMARLSQIKTKEQCWTEVRDMAQAARMGAVTGVPSPWSLFNKYTGGARFGVVTLLVGRSKTRKSYLAHQWGTYAAIQASEPMPGAYYPLEDGQRMAILRAACGLCQFNSHKYERGIKYPDDTWLWEDVDKMVEAAAQRVIKSPYDICSGRGKSLTEWRLDIAKGVAEKGWRFVIIDAFKDIAGSGGDYKDEVRVTEWLCNIADEFNIAIILVHHVKKSRKDNRGKDDSQWERLIKEDARGASQLTDGVRMIVALQCQLRRDADGRNHYTNYVLDCIANSYGDTASLNMDCDTSTGVFVENGANEPFYGWDEDEELAAYDRETKPAWRR